MEGHIKSGRASLRLELFKPKVCSAGYTCELSILDTQGEEIVTRNRVREQRAASGEQTATGVTFPTGSSQLLMVVQQLALLENRLEERMRSIERSVHDSRISTEDNIEDGWKSIEDKMEGRIRSIEDKVEDSRKSIVDKIHESERSIESRTEDSKKSIEDKIEKINDKIETRVVDKLCVLEAKMSASNGPTCLEAGDKHAGFESFLTKQEETLNTTLAISGRIEKYLNESNLRNCLTNTALTTLRSDIAETNRKLSSGFNSTSDLILPRECRKDMPSRAYLTDFPYSVIRPTGESGLTAPYLCDELTDGGGWIVFQRRVSGKVDFYRDWAAYKKGFGSFSDDFWLGNEFLHNLTSTGRYDLRVELNYDGQSAFAEYGEFSIDSEDNGYAIRVGNYSGTAGDSLAYHNGMRFSTFDRDNDKSPRSVAQKWHGAWWYKTGHHSNLNGEWASSTRYRGPSWNGFTDGFPSTYTEMKIRLKETS